MPTPTVFDTSRAIPSRLRNDMRRRVKAGCTEAAERMDPESESDLAIQKPNASVERCATPNAHKCICNASCEIIYVIEKLMDIDWLRRIRGVKKPMRHITVW